MWPSVRGLLCLVPLAAAGVINPEAVDTLRDSYDFIIVGGGPSGLVVANRLSANPAVTVLVLEAGVLDDESFQVMAPGSIGLQDISRYDWKMRTAPQSFLDGKDRPYPLGKVVGGGTVTNGMVWTRGSSADFDSWADFGNEGWSWDDLLPYFKKSETYNPEANEYGTENLGIEPEMGFHGNNGPVEVGYSEYFYHPQSENFLQGCEDLGIPRVGDPNTGNMTGACIAPSGMTLGKQTRASARTSYLNPIVERKNLHVAVGQRVTRVLFDTSKDEPVAVGVEFAAGPDAPVRNVTTDQEVILSAGAIHTPTLLQVSGIGPRAHLESLGVDVLVNLPGVGNNLQDHPMVTPDYFYTAPGLYTSRNLTGAEGENRLQQWRDEATGPYTTPLIHAVAFPAFQWVADDYLARLEELRDGSSVVDLPESYDETLRAGYEAQLESISQLLAQDDVSAYEVMSNSYGTLTISVMQPLSRGNVSATSSSVWDAPIIDPRYCSHPFDCEMMEIGLRFNDRLIETDSMSELEPVAEPGFGAGVDDETLRTSMRANIVSDYHPASTAAMLDRKLGGVVDNALRVHGVAGLRIIDASVMPTIPGAHLQASVYAIAEKGADIIKWRWKSLFDDADLPDFDELPDRNQGQFPDDDDEDDSTSDDQDSDDHENSSGGDSSPVDGNTGNNPINGGNGNDDDENDRDRENGNGNNDNDSANGNDDESHNGNGDGNNSGNDGSDNNDHEHGHGHGPGHNPGHGHGHHHHHCRRHKHKHRRSHI